MLVGVNISDLDRCVCERAGNYRVEDKYEVSQAERTMEKRNRKGTFYVCWRGQMTLHGKRLILIYWHNCCIWGRYMSNSLRQVLNEYNWDF